VLTARHARRIFFVGTAMLALNLRLGITSLPPIFPELRSSLGLSSTTEGLLAATPVVAFGVFSGIAAPLSRTLGEERVLGVALGGVIGGLLLRSIAPHRLLFPGTVVMAGSIALMNVLLASLIKRRYPERAGLLLGAYLVALSGGSMVATAVAVPIFNGSGGSARIALGVWSLPAAAALLTWAPQLRFKTQERFDRGGARRSLLRQPLAWQVTSFMGLQSLCYYAVLSWLPTMLRTRGDSASSAGLVVSLLSVGSVAAAFVVPNLAHARHDQRFLVAPTMLTCILGTLGMLYAPLGLQAVCALVLGAGQGACLALALYFVIVRAPAPDVAASLSAMAQGFGYTVAATGPVVVELIHSAAGSWSPAFGFVIALTLVEWVVADRAARPALVSSPVA